MQASLKLWRKVYNTSTCLSSSKKQQPYNFYVKIDGIFFPDLEIK